MYRVIRFPENPLIHTGLDNQIDANINGPSLIRAPDWVPNRLGRYYLYFAHHQGTFIRMAYADSIHGPWKVHKGGVLKLEGTCCQHHIASPDVHFSMANKEIVMYFHGCTPKGQRTFRAVSPDGLHFHASSVVLGPFYFRVFRHETAWFAIAKTTDAPGGGVLLRSRDGITTFERGPDILPTQRHVAVLKKDDTLHVFFSRGGDCPERILVSTMSLNGDWQAWWPSDPVEVLRSETKEEGAHLPISPSHFGSIHGQVHQLHDPAIYEENGKAYLLYTGAGESNICAAELIEEKISQPSGAGDA
ncbi:MAG: hypothetical protein GY774_05395 [Planctomycetes bacterium]|nr:hypothetical protein [Planctomycetota bacterium]